ncbi:hypothetical protein GUJ93_ZPchr0002g25079 [Zizania palustris]|uniref:Uncharacterized protein n=1 Tax=Zizania palustris TaxID=103762 RepID=A0A8J5SB22_ZIZPA|nr:hypothetical protein GUJ93_ZPchr0002g25079 [Zizania palustris]
MPEVPQIETEVTAKRRLRCAAAALAGDWGGGGEIDLVPLTRLSTQSLDWLQVTSAPVVLSPEVFLISAVLPSASNADAAHTVVILKLNMVRLFYLKCHTDPSLVQRQEKISGRGAEVLNNSNILNCRRNTDALLKLLNRGNIPDSPNPGVIMECLLHRKLFGPAMQALKSSGADAARGTAPSQPSRQKLMMTLRA